MKSLLAVLAKLGLITSAEVDEPTAVTQVTAKFTEITTASSKASADLVTASKSLDDTKAELVKAKKETAKTVVSAAIAAGRIPGQDAAIVAKWEGLIEADPANASLLPEPNPALTRLVQAKGKTDAKNEGGGEHAFLIKAKEYQTEHKVSESFAFQKVAAKEPDLYNDYRVSLGLGGK